MCYICTSTFEDGTLNSRQFFACLFLKEEWRLFLIVVFSSGEACSTNRIFHGTPLTRIFVDQKHNARQEGTAEVSTGESMTTVWASKFSSCLYGKSRRTDGGLGKRTNVTHLSDTYLSCIHVHTDICLLFKSFQPPFKSHISVFFGCENLTSIFGQFTVNDLRSKMKPGNI